MSQNIDFSVKMSQNFGFYVEILVLVQNLLVFS